MSAMQRNRKAYAAMTTNHQPAPNPCKRCKSAPIRKFGTILYYFACGCGNESQGAWTWDASLLAWNEENPREEKHEN